MIVKDSPVLPHVVAYISGDTKTVARWREGGQTTASRLYIVHVLYFTHNASHLQFERLSRVPAMPWHKHDKSLIWLDLEHGIDDKVCHL
jgi:hypothetical protein